MSVRLASAQAGDKVRALEGIDRDPEWENVPKPWRPEPNAVYTVAQAAVCPCCGEESFVLAEIPLMLVLNKTGAHINSAGLKADWFVPEGRSRQ